MSFLIQNWSKFTYAIIILYGIIIPHSIANDCDIIGTFLQQLDRNNYSMDDCCKHKGVTCDSDNYITEIIYSTTNCDKLSDPIHELNKLDRLTSLSINNCKISFDHSLSEDFGSLVGLEKLDLSNNNFNGQIPASFGKLVNLKSLNLKDNKLEGTIPSELENLTKLTELNLKNNNGLKGPVPLLNVTECDYRKTGLCYLEGAKCKSSVNLCTEEEINSSKKSSSSGGGGSSSGGDLIIRLFFLIIFGIVLCCVCKCCSNNAPKRSRAFVQITPPNTDNNRTQVTINNNINSNNNNNNTTTIASNNNIPTTGNGNNVLSNPVILSPVNQIYNPTIPPTIIGSAAQAVPIAVPTTAYNPQVSSPYSAEPNKPLASNSPYAAYVAYGSSFAASTSTPANDSSDPPPYSIN